MAAAHGGAQVLATDQAQGRWPSRTTTPGATTSRSTWRPADWTDPVAAVAGAPWDFVLAADVLYLHSGLDALRALLPRLVGSTGEIWIADQARPPARDFLTACCDWAIISTASTAIPEVTIHRLRPRRPSGTDSGPVKRTSA